jgi:hypothetical protein
MDHLAANIAIVLALMCIGQWLGGINGKHGFFDELLTPLPLGFAGIIIVMERTLAWA